MGYVFGNTSKRRLSTCHNDLILIAEEALKYSYLDFGITQGARTVEQQKEYYKKGTSKINPDSYASLEDLADKANHIVIEGHSKYNVSRAFDIYAWIPGRKDLMWNSNYLNVIGGTIMSTAERLYEEGKISHQLRWGNDWNQNRILVTEDKKESLVDAPHFELLNY